MGTFVRDGAFDLGLELGKGARPTRIMGTFVRAPLDLGHGVCPCVDLTGGFRRRLLTKIENSKFMGKCVRGSKSRVFTDTVIKLMTEAELGRVLAK